MTRRRTFVEPYTIISERVEHENELSSSNYLGLSSQYESSTRRKHPLIKFTFWIALITCKTYVFMFFALHHNQTPSRNLSKTIIFKFIYKSNQFFEFQQKSIRYKSQTDVEIRWQTTSSYSVLQSLLEKTLSICMSNEY